MEQHPATGTDEVRLRDGTRLVVRPIAPADAAALVALHARLSADTIYRRYFGARPHLSPADVERFTRVDGRDRFALVAAREHDLVGVARYEGMPGGRNAEIAVVVDDALQHQGLGRLLLGRLVDVARERGLATLVAEVLAGNTVSAIHPSELQVAIVGAGIGGLSLGLALRERGLHAAIFEQAPELTEVARPAVLSASNAGWEGLTGSALEPRQRLVEHGTRVRRHPTSPGVEPTERGL